MLKSFKNLLSKKSNIKEDDKKENKDIYEELKKERNLLKKQFYIESQEYEILKENYTDYDYSFKVILIGNSGNFYKKNF